MPSRALDVRSHLVESKHIAAREVAPRRRLRDGASPETAIQEVRVPLVEGTPVSFGSISTASRSARANALKHASIM